MQTYKTAANKRHGNTEYNKGKRQEPKDRGRKVGSVEHMTPKSKAGRTDANETDKKKLERGNVENKKERRQTRGRRGTATTLKHGGTKKMSTNKKR